MIEHVERLYRRVLSLVGRGRLTLVGDAGAVQLVQAQVNGQALQDDVPRLAEYGFQSVPPAGADAVVLFLGGNASDGVVIATGHQTYRLRNLAPGEVAISDDHGRRVHLTAAGIVIDGGGAPVAIVNAPTVTMDGNLQVAGNVSDAAGTMAAMRSAHNAHRGHGSPGTGAAPDHLM